MLPPLGGGVMGWEIDWMGGEYYVSVSRQLNDLKKWKKMRLKYKIISTLKLLRHWICLAI